MKITVFDEPDNWCDLAQNTHQTRARSWMLKANIIYRSYVEEWEAGKRKNERIQKVELFNGWKRWHV